MFAEAILDRFPDRMLAYNCTPSFNWKKHLDDEEIARFRKELAAMGYRFQFVTLAGFHALNASMFELAHGYADEGMSAYVRLQEREMALEADGYTATRHQQEVGTGYFDLVADVISGGRSATDGPRRVHRARAVLTLDLRRAAACGAAPIIDGRIGREVVDGASGRCRSSSGVASPASPRPGSSAAADGACSSSRHGSGSAAERGSPRSPASTSRWAARSSIGASRTCGRRSPGTAWASSNSRKPTAHSCGETTGSRSSTRRRSSTSTKRCERLCAGTEAYLAEPMSIPEGAAAVEADLVSTAERIAALDLDPRNRDLLDALCAGLSSAPNDHVGFLDIARSFALAGFVGQMVLDTNGRWALEGGTASLVDAMHRDLRADVRLGTRVEAIAQDETGVTVRTTDGELAASAAIVALPVNALGAIRFEPGALGTETRGRARKGS